MNGNKIVVTCSLLLKILKGLGLYCTTTTLPVLNGSLRTHRYPLIPLFKVALITVQYLVAHCYQAELGSHQKTLQLPPRQT